MYERFSTIADILFVSSNFDTRTSGADCAHSNWQLKHFYCQLSFVGTVYLVSSLSLVCKTALTLTRIFNVYLGCRDCKTSLSLTKRFSIDLACWVLKK